MDAEPFFLSEETILAFHAEQIRLFGGMDGLGDPAGFSSAVASPQNVYLYEPDATLFEEFLEPLKCLPDGFTVVYERNHLPALHKSFQD